MGVINGIVTDKSNGLPIIGAIVILRSPPYFATKETDANGTYSFYGTPEYTGYFQMDVTATGYISFYKICNATETVNVQLAKLAPPTTPPTTPTLKSRLPLIIAVALIATIGIVLVIKKK